MIPTTIARRARWLHDIVQISGHFGNDSTRIEHELNQETQSEGINSILDHLRLAGSIPEQYGHDSSEEKLYSKYTDAILSTSFTHIGLNSTVLTERGDAADVEAANSDYALVGDAKAFRLSRTAKNQKDFKIEAMDGWKRGKPYAIVVCPIYQLPNRSSQIYHQAITRTVCIFTYSHLSVLVRLAEVTNTKNAMDALHSILRCTSTLNPSKDAIPYWHQINKAMLDSHSSVESLWREEKIANLESIEAARNESLTALAVERQRILQMSHDEAIQSLIRYKNIDGRRKVISAVSDSGILEIS
ncbi:MAG: restriction endonuclease [Phenylobacterium zucineum]|nr:MAG: restriction endonuclease [Phenylobacterium zucineum]